MKKLLLSLVLAAAFVTREAPAQVPTQEQLQTADAQLNQVYQQLRGALNDAQKQQLKQAQREWIKQRDAFVAQNYGNPQGALYQATMQRGAYLKLVLSKTSRAVAPSPEEQQMQYNESIKLDNELFRIPNYRDVISQIKEQWVKKIGESVHLNKVNALLIIYRLNQERIDCFKKLLLGQVKEIVPPQIRDPYTNEKNNISNLRNGELNDPKDFEFYPIKEYRDILNNQSTDKLYQDPDWLISVSKELYSGEETYISNLSFYNSKTLELVSNISVLGLLQKIHKKVDDTFNIELAGGNLGVNGRSHDCNIDPINKKFVWLSYDSIDFSSNNQLKDKYTNQLGTNDCQKVMQKDDSGGLSYLKLNNVNNEHQEKSISFNNIQNEKNAINNNTSLSSVFDETKRKYIFLELTMTE
jgi:hypothetical protein